MTKREFLLTVANGTMNTEVIEYALVALEKMNETAEKIKSRNAAKVSEKNEPLKAAIMEILTNENAPMFTAAVAEKANISTQKAARLLGQLVEIGSVKMDAAVVRSKGVRKVYSVAGV